MTDARLQQLLVLPDSSLRDAMLCIQENGEGIALVVDGDRKLVATITDGDLRTAILRGVDLDDSLAEIIEFKALLADRGPITAPRGAPSAQLLELMSQHSIRQIPLLDSAGRVVDVALLRELAADAEPQLSAVVMAGGRGNRLRPLTDDLPKPMLPMGDKPVLERIVDQLVTAGVRRVSVSTHYKSEKIISHFGDGERFGLEMNYVTENQPLGTAGALTLLDRPQSPMLVINGDILTQVDFRAMLAFHRDHRALMTVGVRQFEMRIPYGVVDTDGAHVTGLSEKPCFKLFINAGVYLLDPQAWDYIPTGRRYDMTQLIERLLSRELPVVSFPIHEYWLDIGQHSDYERALDDVKNGVFKVGLGS